ncbi:MAG: hypothetical protein M3O55_09145 [Actinomycetota bacterium]|nr:hypothetical protein [Actinomycetota bacterium]
MGPPQPAQPQSNIPPIRPGEIVCPVCGWGNEPTRKFCRHDGAVLSGGPGGAAPPMKAGQRNKKRQGGGGGKAILVVLAVLLPLLLAGGAVGGYLLLKADKKTTGGGGTAAESPSPTPTSTAGATQVPASAVKVLAFTSQSPTRNATNTIDGNPDTFWSARFPSGIPGNPQPDIDRRPHIKYGFAQPVTLTRLEIRNGASGADFAKRPRVNKIVLRFDDGTTQEANLKDDGQGFQTVQIKTPKKVSAIQIEIVTAYFGTATGNDKYRFSFAEVRFFSKG